MRALRADTYPEQLQCHIRGASSRATAQAQGHVHGPVRVVGNAAVPRVRENATGFDGGEIRPRRNPRGGREDCGVAHHQRCRSRNAGIACVHRSRAAAHGDTPAGTRQLQRRCPEKKGHALAKRIVNPQPSPLAHTRAVQREYPAWDSRARRHARTGATCLSPACVAPPPAKLSMTRWDEIGISLDCSNASRHDR